MTAQITEPGVYDIRIEEYHADPVPDGSLSSTGARKLLPPSCPALFKYELDHPPAPTSDMSYGSAAHKQVLGVGPELVVVDVDDWRTKAAREAKAEAEQRGAIPLKTEQWERIQAMEQAIREHGHASLLLSGSGMAEQTLVWRDGDLWRRALLDWLPVPTEGRRLIIPDYKTIGSADRESIQRDIYRYGYHQQATWYLDGVQALLGVEAAFVFVFQEKNPPYLVTLAQLDHDALRTGQALNRRAMQIYTECRQADHWPAYSSGVELISLPRWADVRYAEEVL